MDTAKEKVLVFCQNSSLRGVNKIIKSPHLLLRIMWLFYVFMMVFMLFYSVGRILTEYLAYDTTVQTSMKLDDPTNFPALTICSHYPFRENAKDFWKSGEIMSPTQFNRNIRKISKQLIANNRSQEALLVYSHDKLTSYYQNMTTEQTINLSHQPSKLFSYCIVGLTSNEMVYGFEPEQCVETIHFSHPKYFNCYVVQGFSDSLQEIKSMSLIVNLDGLTAPGNSEYEEAFTQDVFDQASGVRMAVHESHTRPDIEVEGFHVEPGRMVEIIYKATEFEKANVPNDECKPDAKIPENGRLPADEVIRDLEDNFRYTKETCSYAKVNEHIARECKCVYAYYARPFIPNEEVPYCGALNERNVTDFFARLECVSNINIKRLRKKYEQSSCRSRCRKFHFETHLSSTLWTPTKWQLYWSLKTGGAFVDALDWKRQNRTDLFKIKMKEVQEYLDADNLRSSSGQPVVSVKNNSYVYVTLKRGSADTTYKEEKLQLSPNAMFSRVGGLCSLYLGLTCAFFIELIEFMYLMKQQRREAAELAAIEMLGNEKNKQMETQVTLINGTATDDYQNDDNEDENSETIVKKRSAYV